MNNVANLRQASRDLLQHVQSFGYPKLGCVTHVLAQVFLASSHYNEVLTRFGILSCVEDWNDIR